MDWKTKLLLVVTVVVVVAAGARWLERSSEPAGAQGPPVSLYVVSSGCDPDNPTKAQITFGWYGSALWYEAWLDLSLENNGFIPGTFAGAGPIPPEPTHDPSLEPWVALYTWSGIEPGLTHYWRVNLRYYDGWYASPTYTFDSPVCGGHAGGVTPPPGTATQPGTAELEQRVADLEARVQSLEQKVELLKAGHNTLVAAHNTLQQDHNDLLAAHNDLVSKFNRLVRQLQYEY